MESDYVYAMQSYCLPKYQELFKVIANLGGCILRQQLTRLLFKNRTDYSQADALVKKLLDAKLVKIQYIGRNSILMLTYPVFRYLGIDRTTNLNGTRLKLSALILEKYLRQGVWRQDDPVMALRKRMEKTSALFFRPLGEPHMRQLYALMQAFEERGLDTDGLRYQYDRAEKRMEHGFRKEYSQHKIDLTKEADLYTLERKSIYLTGVKEQENAYGRRELTGIVDMYWISDLSPSQMSEYIIEAKRVIESTLQNDCGTQFHIYSHGAEDKAYTERVYTALEQYPEYVLPDAARQQVTFHFFNTRRTLFGGVSPSAIK